MRRAYPSLPATSRTGTADHGKRATRARAATGRDARTSRAGACGDSLSRGGDRVSRPVVRDHGRTPFLDEVAHTRVPAAVQGALDTDGNALFGARDRMRS